jgi:hypothetical protein
VAAVVLVHTAQLQLDLVVLAVAVVHILLTQFH